MVQREKIVTMIGILDYGMGNLASVCNSLEFLGFDIKVARNAEDIKKLTHLIVPGVGSFAKAMQNLEDKNLIAAIKGHVSNGKPYLGVCLGMQLLATTGYEGGKVKGLGLLEGEVKPFKIKLHVPHVGWNSIKYSREHPVLNKQADHLDYYFVHSYFFHAKNTKDILTTTDYETSFTSAVGKDNVIGVQFHPEKSQEPGLSLLESFCEWDGRC